MNEIISTFFKPPSFIGYFFNVSIFILILAFLISGFDRLLFGQVAQSLIIVWLCMGIGKAILRIVKKK